MRAVRLYEYGGPDVLRYEESASEPAIASDTVLIRSVATSVNLIDWNIRSGARKTGLPLTLPAIVSNDVSGVVMAVGSEVRTSSLATI